jgi:hypothetical protein
MENQISIWLIGRLAAARSSAMIWQITSGVNFAGAQGRGCVAQTRRHPSGGIRLAPAAAPVASNSHFDISVMNCRSGSLPCGLW